MLRKTMVVLAIALALGSSPLSTTAFARSGGGAFGGVGFGGGHFGGGFGGGRIAGDGYRGYDHRVSGLDGGFHHRNGRGYVWGHWGAYYGPMITDP